MTKRPFPHKWFTNGEVEVRPVDMQEEIRDRARDEDGDAVCCPDCGLDEFYWTEDGELVVCLDCETEMDREDFFNYIGANPPSGRCLHCTGHYPQCKRDCDEEGVTIDPDDLYLD